MISRQEWRILESKVKLREADEVSTKLRKALTLVLLAVFLFIRFALLRPWLTRYFW